MQTETFDITDVMLFKPKGFEDDRGFFMETFKSAFFKSATGLDIEFVQDNFSFSKHQGTVRGLHYQAPPFDQGKLVRCTRGEVADVAVDVRPNSPTYGQHVKVILSDKNHHQLWVPPGFLHGFATLADDCEVAYKVTNYYSKECDGNVLWNDPALDIDWGINNETAVLSDKDKVAPILASWKNPF